MFDADGLLSMAGSTFSQDEHSLYEDSMDGPMSRFEMVKEPAGSWAVFDDVIGDPAQQDGRDLVGLAREEAELAMLQCKHPSHACKLLSFELRRLIKTPIVTIERMGRHEDAP